MGVIYKITSPNLRKYVGKTYCLRKRINSHKSNSKKETGIILMNSIKKYGWGAHKIEVIEEVDDSLLNEREMFWIKELKTYCYDFPGQMNMTKGGEGQRSTWKHDVERVKRASERFKGVNAPFYGRHHTEENKKIIGDKARIRNKETGKIVPEWGAEKGRNVVRKPIVCYSSDGIFVKEFTCAAAAALEMRLEHTSISMVCSNKRTHVGGFVFRYRTDNYSKKINVGELKQQTIKRPVLTLTPEYEIVCEHTSAQEASDFWGIPKTTINRTAMYNWLKPIRSGHVFIYKDLYEKLKLVS